MMQTAPTLEEVIKHRDDTLNTFVVCNEEGVLIAYATVKASRYVLGAAKPVKVGEWLIRFISEQDFDIKEHTLGDVIWLQNQYQFIVGTEGSILATVSKAQWQSIKNKRDEEKQQHSFQQQESRDKHERWCRFQQSVKRRQQRLDNYTAQFTIFPKLKVYAELLKFEQHSQSIIESVNLQSFSTQNEKDLQGYIESEQLNLDVLRRGIKTEFYNREVIEVHNGELEKRRLEQQKIQQQEESWQQYILEQEASQQRRKEERRVSEEKEAAYIANANQSWSAWRDGIAKSRRDEQARMAIRESERAKEKLSCDRKNENTSTE